jgi:cobalamin biosynthetic protein CobC
MEAVRRYGIPREQWLDLSTGINPHPFVPPSLALTAWQRLPEDNDGLENAAESYYGNAQLLPLAGSQAAIQALPRLLPTTDVACVTPIYNEHPAAWRNAGHTVHLCATLDQAIERGHIVILCNPNNPDGRMLDRATLLTSSQRLAAKHGWLIVDEAFIDPHSNFSVTADAGNACENLVVLRSLGKFFGLAGARVGFIFASESLRRPLNEMLGPWALSHPSRIVASAALGDKAWQAAAQHALLEAGKRLSIQLSVIGHNSGPALFRYFPSQQAAHLHEFLAERGILTRLFDDPPALRFGLPAEESEWQRLSLALDEWKAA